MIDDIDQKICGSKHYGPVLREEDGSLVKRCSFCDLIFKAPINPGAGKAQKKKSSKSCIQACDWFCEDQTVRCKSCGYTGPVP